MDRIEPEHFFSWTWSPGSAKPGPDHSSKDRSGEDRSGEETTLVEFHLEEVDGGTLITVTESGFDRISIARRAKALEENSKGWEHQLNALDKYVVHAG